MPDSVDQRTAGGGQAGGTAGAASGGELGRFDKASAGLAPIARDVEAAKGNAQSGILRMDEDSARDLLASLAKIQAKVHKLIGKDGGDLTEPLRFGDSFVAHALSKRLEGAASGGTRAAIPVLKEFSDVLEDLELTVRTAAGLYVAQDEDAQDRLQRVLGKFGLEEFAAPEESADTPEGVK